MSLTNKEVSGASERPEEAEPISFASIWQAEQFLAPLIDHTPLVHSQALSEEVDQLLDEYRRLIEETRGGSSPES